MCRNKKNKIKIKNYNKIINIFSRKINNNKITEKETNLNK